MMKYIKAQASLCTVLATLIGALVITHIMGWQLCVIQTGSMEPTIPTHSVCLVKTNVDYAELEVGDVVVYTRETDGKRIVHRIIEITDDGAVTKGDANASDDGISVTADNLYAKYVAHIPYLGRVLGLLRSPYGTAIIAILLIALVGLNIIDVRKKANHT